MRLLHESFSTFFLSSPHVPPTSPREGEVGGKGEGEEAPGVLRSIDPKTLFPRVAETHALPASVPQSTILRTIVKSHQKPKFLITLEEIRLTILPQMVISRSRLRLGADGYYIAYAASCRR